jgi:hypothetical protein
VLVERELHHRLTVLPRHVLVAAAHGAVMVMVLVVLVVEALRLARLA